MNKILQWLRFIVRAPLMVMLGAAEGTGVYPTLLDVSRSIDPNGNTADIVELLQQTNAPLLDIPYIEGNLPTGHQTTVRTGLPTAYWRKWYQGVPAGKSTYAQIVDACGNLESRSEIDKDAADFNGNTASFRLAESFAFLEAMNQAMMTALMYGDATINPEQFNGLAPRYSSLSAGNAQNIIDAGGTGADNTSVWLVCWGKNTIHGTFPKGSMAGLTMEDLGTFDAFDTVNNRYRAVGDIYKWKCGIVLKDWRYVVRISNIDVSNLTTEQGAADLLKAMIKALHRVPNVGIVQTGVENVAANGAKEIPMAPNPVFYCNRTVAEMLDIQSLNKTQYTLKSGNDVYGRPITFCRGIPVRTCDQILLTEAQVK